MDPVPLTVDLRLLERKEKRSLVVLTAALIVLGSVSVYLIGVAASLRLYTITSAPSYVPIGFQQTLFDAGLVTGAALSVGLWAFAQLFRCITIRRSIEAFGPQAPPSVSSRATAPEPPPRGP